MVLSNLFSLLPFLMMMVMVMVVVMLVKMMLCPDD